MNTKQMNEFLERCNRFHPVDNPRVNNIPDSIRYIAIDSNGNIYGYNEKPTYKIYEWANYVESKFFFLGITTKPTNPELEIYTYG